MRFPWGIGAVLIFLTVEMAAFYATRSRFAAYLGPDAFALASVVSIASLLPAGLVAVLAGARGAAILGGLALAAGAIAFRVFPDVGSAAIVCVAGGAALVKVAAMALAADRFSDDDPRRDAAFTMLFVGIHVGAAIGPVGMMVADLTRMGRGFWVWGAIAATAAVLPGLARPAPVTGEDRGPRRAATTVATLAVLALLAAAMALAAQQGSWLPRPELDRMDIAGFAAPIPLVGVLAVAGFLVIGPLLIFTWATLGERAPGTAGKLVVALVLAAGTALAILPLVGREAAPLSAFIPHYLAVWLANLAFIGAAMALVTTLAASRWRPAVVGLWLTLSGGADLVVERLAEPLGALGATASIVIAAAACLAVAALGYTLLHRLSGRTRARR